MDKQFENEVLSEIEKAYKLLDGIHAKMIEGNTGDKQFDYVTNPKASDGVDLISKKVEIISKIMYQKYK